jgi:hypothetical protein
VGTGGVVVQLTRQVAKVWVTGNRKVDSIDNFKPDTITLNITHARADIALAPSAADDVLPVLMLS